LGATELREKKTNWISLSFRYCPSRFPTPKYHHQAINAPYAPSILMNYNNVIRFLIIAVNRADFGSTNDELSEAWLGMIRGFQEASKAALGCRKRLGKSPFYLIIWGKA
jgi:hypothetical protein